MFPRIGSLLMGCALLLAVTARAQLGPEIARQHAERAGDKLAALHSLRGEGRIFIAGEAVDFVMTAERPDRLRVESYTAQRRVIQGYDGAGRPWISHTDTQAGAPQDMTEADARDFLVSADFDGVLVDYARKGYSVDYAGENVIGDRRAAKLLIMGPRDEIFFLWVDLETHEILQRLLYRPHNGQRAPVVTSFTDFRRVGGVLQAHRIETKVNGTAVYLMILDHMEANPIIAPGTFARN